MTPEDRAWEVVRRAFEERTHSAPGTRAGGSSSPGRTGLVLALVAAAALAAGIATTPVRALVASVRDAVGSDRAAPALFSLPAPGRLLVVSRNGGGVWIADADGSKRRLGEYDDARWSPFGRFVVAARDNALVALGPDGTERWSLARRGVASPRWGGTHTDTRVAYCSADGLRVVAGDGTADRLVSPRACSAEWRPGPEHVLTYLDGDTVVARDVDTDRVLWRSEGSGKLAWSSYGERLAVASGHRVRLLDGGGRSLRTLRFRRTVLGASFAPGSHSSPSTSAQATARARPARSGS